MDHSYIFTPLDDAIEEINVRRSNPDLFKAVEEYLNGDVPAHFKPNTPILYLCRHIATPNFEALRFVEIGQGCKLPLVIGEDPKGIFYANNPLKRSLGKLPVVKGIARNYDEIIENFTVVNFPDAEGKSFSEITTLTNTNLVSLHHNLFEQIYPRGIHIADESSWIDRNFRDNLLEQYKRTLSLLVVHGIMFESYTTEEKGLVEEILLPAFEFVKSTFGHKPLIHELISKELDAQRNWNEYPSVLYRFLADEYKK